MTIKRARSDVNAVWTRSLIAFLLVQLAEAKTCLMLFQMADNNLEYYLRQDYLELTNSAVVRNSDLRTWVYHDSLNQGGQPLPNTVDGSGRAVTSRFTGSRYIVYDNSIGKMRVDQVLTGEINSDTEWAVTNFLTHSMTDCLNTGFDSLMAVFASHGGGFAGIGGDENTRHRKLLQLNRQVASGIRSALDSVSGAPSKLEVIGFDACLMQAFGAADDYKDVANHLLGSEAVEPGHGWAYQHLSNAQDALTLSREVVSTFLGQTQGRTYHQTPKQLSIVDLGANGYIRFLAHFEELSSILLSRINQDQTLHAFIARARSSAVAFEGIVDAVGTSNPSAMDIGSFLAIFDAMCNPPAGSDLGDSLANTRDAYDAMMVAQGIGPGTAQGTGMHLTWPNKGEYQTNKALWNTILFNSHNYATFSAPQFNDLLEYFLNANTPPTSGGTSICNQAAQSAKPRDPGALLFDTKSDIESTRVTLSAEMAPFVDQVVVEYAVDLTSPLGPFLREKGYVPYDEEFLYLKGGDVRGSYKGSTYTAEWNRDFYFLNITGSSRYEALYVQDQGNGAKASPVMYFPESAREEVSKLAFLDFLFFDFDGWVQRGARYGFLTFSVRNGVVDNNLILFTSDSTGNAFAEKSRSDGGLMIPLVYVDAFIQDRYINTLPGGFNQTVVNWREDLDYNVIARKADVIFHIIPATDAVVATMHGYDFAKSHEPLESKYFDIIRPDRGEADLEGELPIVSDSAAQASSSDMLFPCRTITLTICALLYLFQA